MTQLTGAPSQKSTGVIDLRAIDLESRVAKLESFGRTAASAYRVAAQIIKPSVFTRILVDTAAFDVGGNMNLGEGFYVVPESGIYFVSGQIAYANVVLESNALASIFQSGGEALRGTRILSAHTPTIVNMQVVGLLHCNAGEKLELFGFTSNETPLEISSAENRLSVIRVA